MPMPRLSVPLTDEQHEAIKARAFQQRLPQAEIARVLLLAWLQNPEMIVKDDDGKWYYISLHGPREVVDEIY
jgi:hypothetical protein